MSLYNKGIGKQSCSVRWRACLPAYTQKPRASGKAPITPNCQQQSPSRHEGLPCDSANSRPFLYPSGYRVCCNKYDIALEVRKEDSRTCFYVICDDENSDSDLVVPWPLRRSLYPPRTGWAKFHLKVPAFTKGHRKLWDLGCKIETRQK